MGGEDAARSWAALMAALLKWPSAMRVSRGVDGSGCKDDTRNGGGTSSSVNGWYISGRSRYPKSLVGARVEPRGDSVDWAVLKERFEDRFDGWGEGSRGAICWRGERFPARGENCDWEEVRAVGERSWGCGFCVGERDPDMSGESGWSIISVLIMLVLWRSMRKGNPTRQNLVALLSFDG